MTDDEYARLLRAFVQARGNPGGYITIPAGVMIALHDAILEVEREEKAKSRNHPSE